MAGSPRRSDRASGRARLGVTMTALAGLALSAALAPAPLRAEEPAATAEPGTVRPETVRLISHRQGELRRMGAAMRVIGRFLKSEGANVTDVGASAEVIRAIAGEFTTAMFPEGTAIGVGRSAARPEIWQEWDIFKERATALQGAAARLVSAAATGHADAVREPILAVGQACGACHELYRRKLP